ncbi:MAG: hypothetical protein AAF092_05070 [Pseudomonadota bacterium]
MDQSNTSGARGLTWRALAGFIVHYRSLLSVLVAAASWLVYTFVLPVLHAEFEREVLRIVEGADSPETHRPSPNHAVPAVFPRRGHSVSAGQIGSFVRVKFRIRKMRDCGAPSFDLVFYNGSDALHRFSDVSIVGPDGRGINLPVDPERDQIIEYFARIPSDDGVTPGSGLAWLNDFHYPDCPGHQTVIVPPQLPFLIGDKMAPARYPDL